jgi:hypothetical protein
MDFSGQSPTIDRRQIAELFGVSFESKAGRVDANKPSDD